MTLKDFAYWYMDTQGIENKDRVFEGMKNDPINKEMLNRWYDDLSQYIEEVIKVQIIIAIEDRLNK